MAKLPTVSTIRTGLIFSEMEFAMSMRKRTVSLIAGGAATLLLGLGYGLYAWRAEPRTRELATTPPAASSQSNDRTDSAIATGDSPADNADIPQTPTRPSDLTPEQIRQVVAGHWTSEYYGTRYLTVRNDGTATILFQANTMARMVVGARLRIEYTWEYDPSKERVIFTMVDGGPESGIAYVRKLWGNQQKQDVLFVCTGELHLRDLDGKTEHHWVALNEIPNKVQDRFAKL